MADFYLESPAALGKLADQVQRAGDDGAAGQRHVEKYANLTYPAEEGLLLDIMASHEHAYDLVRGAMEAIAVRARYTAKVINETADLYARSDDEERQRVDRLFHGLDEFAPPPNFSRYDRARGPAFSDLGEPSDHFKQPERPDDTGPLFKFDPKSDTFSPVAWVRMACVELVGADPFEWMVRWLSGDWVAYHRCVTVWEQVAAACEQLGANIGRAGADTEFVWRGKASDECRQYLHRLSHAVSDFAPICKKLADHYRAGVKAAQQFNEALAGLAAMLTEMAAMWAACTIALRVGHRTSRAERDAFLATILFYSKQIIEMAADLQSLYGQYKDMTTGLAGMSKALEFGELRDVRPPRMLLSPGSPL